MDYRKRMTAVLIAAVLLSGCSFSDNIGTAVNDGNSGSTASADLSRANGEIIFSDEIIVSGNGASSNGNTVIISAGGKYILSGKSEDASVLVKASEAANVTLVLNNLEISSNNGSAILIESCKNAFIQLADNSVNTLSDSGSYPEGSADACIYSKKDLSIGGNGTLSVIGNYKHGIYSKDDIEISSGNINVSSASTGINGRDSVTVSGGEITVNAGTNGIRSDNSKSDKGNILVSGGKITVVSDGDAIDAENILDISGGDISVTTGGGSVFSSGQDLGSTEPPEGGFPEGITPPNNDFFKDFDGERPEGMDPPDNDFFKKFDGERPEGMTPPDGDFFKDFDGERPERPDGNFGDFGKRDGGFQGFDPDSKKKSKKETSVSSKALKSGTMISVSAGDITVNSSDDALHSGGNVGISGGSLKINSGDDAIHADGDISIESAVINILRCNEGLEGRNIKIKSGNININSEDDSINCADENASGNRKFEALEGVGLDISGGDIVISTYGDGIDSNGTFIMSGGTLLISGPENGMNNSIDVNGKAEITGGTVISCGAVGMEMGFSDTSAQYSVLHNLSERINAGEKLTVKDSGGNEILSFTPDKRYQSVIISSPEIKNGETYTITAGNISEEVTVTGISTSNSTGGFMPPR